MPEFITTSTESLHQPQFFMNEAELETAEFTANKIKIDTEKVRSEETAKFVVKTLDQMTNNDLMGSTPQLAAPTVYIDAEAMKNLLADLENIVGELELDFVVASFVLKAVSDLRSKGIEPDLTTVLGLFVAYASSVVPEVTPEIQQFFSDLAAVKNEQDLARTLKGYIDSVLEDLSGDTPPGPASDPTPTTKTMFQLLLALLFDLIETQNLRDQADAELEGDLQVWSLEQSELDAEKTIKMGLLGLVSAGAAFGFTASITGVSTGMQIKGWRESTKLSRLQVETNNLQKEVNSSKLDPTIKHNRRQELEFELERVERSIWDLEKRSGTDGWRNHNKLSALDEGSTGGWKEHEALKMSKSVELNRGKEAFELEKRKIKAEVSDVENTYKEDELKLKRRINQIYSEKQPGDLGLYERDSSGFYDTYTKDQRARAAKLEKQIASNNVDLTEYKQRMGQKLDNVGMKQSRFDERINNDIEFDRNSMAELSRSKHLLAKRKGEITDEINKMENDAIGFDERHLKKEQELLDKQNEIHNLAGSPDFYRNIGFAMSGMNNGSQVFVDGFGFMSKKEEAERTRAQAKKEGFSQMAQQRDQERTSGAGGMRASLMSIVESLYRSYIDTLGEVARAIKG